MNWYRDLGISSKLILIATLGGIVILTSTWWTLDSLREDSTIAAGYKAASSMAGQIATMRSFYTSEILPRAKKAGVTANYDYIEHQGMLPLPATFVHVLSEQITKNNSGMKVRLYSRYPFPHRAATEQYDDFEMQALESLERDPKTPYWQVTEVDGNKSLRYAQADVMLESCVSCHNSHPETPKDDWLVGQTRGVVEVIVSVEDVEQVISASTIKVSSIILTVISLLALIMYQVIKGNILNPAIELKQVASQLADGDLTVNSHCTSNDALGQISQSINDMVEKFRTTVGKISNSAMQVASSSEELTAITNNVQQDILTQKSETEMVATAMNEMSCTSRQVAENAKDAANAANTAKEDAMTGKTMVSDAVMAINSLAKDLGHVSAVVRELEEESNNIGTVLDVISDIAEQTNLLALNAAIEAARAGEQGRGFAVVADEVRTLANRTEDSTKEIQQMIEKLQKGSLSAVKSMEDNNKIVEETVDKASSIEDMLDKISEQVGFTSDLYSQISVAVDEQSTVAEDMNRNISSINEGMNTTETSSTQVALASKELAGLSTGLQVLVEQFKVK